ncbi:zinc-binding dehydrogenase [Zhouia spongiae]|uniref:zinc-binding dehydrogenase n=1 Tax=Zhouia spongiae TaxID=2202721 RepID=UPI003BFA677A
MINGSSSGGGHLAIQIAEACGAEVTSVSSTNNLSLCKKLVADHTIDYRNEDFTKSDKKFDVIFDVVLTKSYKETRRLLNPKGIYIGRPPH